MNGLDMVIFMGPFELKIIIKINKIIWSTFLQGISNENASKLPLSRAPVVITSRTPNKYQISSTLTFINLEMT